jgi:MFS family permease
LTELTDNDAVAVGISLSLQFGPILVLGPFVGPLVDRVSGRAIILTTTIVELTLGLILGVAVVMGVATLPLVYALALGLGISQAFEAPARMAFVSELVGTGNIPNAIGMNSMMVLLKRWVQPWAPPADTTAGWAPDPTGRFPLRWWDGLRWTESVHADGKNTTDYPFR